METISSWSPKSGDQSIGKEVSVLVGRMRDRSRRAVVESFDSFFRDGIATDYLVRFVDTGEAEWVAYDRVAWEQ